MMPPPKEVLANAIGVLSEQVLPQLSATTWNAANVRACITLLTYVEDAMADGDKAVSAQADAMRSIMSFVSGSNEAWLTEELRARCGNAADAQAPVSYETNVHFKELLSQVVEQSAGKRSALFQDKLRACLAVINEAEFSAMARASKLQPF
ncbi:MAG: hypothetical protein ABWZ40_15020 [Caulobacterales bacterium]